MILYHDVIAEVIRIIAEMDTFEYLHLIWMTRLQIQHRSTRSSTLAELYSS